MEAPGDSAEQAGQAPTGPPSSSPTPPAPGATAEPTWRHPCQKLDSIFFTEPSYPVESDLGLPDDDRAGEVVAEYWKRSFQGTDSARARAQTGFAIVSAVATVFIGGSAFSRVQDQSITTKLLASLASILWVLAIAYYLNAATAASKPGALLGGKNNSPSDFPTMRGGGKWSKVLARATLIVQIERSSLVWRTRRANILGIAASFLSVLTLIALMATAPASERLSNLYLTTEGFTAVRLAQCSPTKENPEFIRGILDSANLEKPFLELEAEVTPTCLTGKTILIKRDWIRFATVAE